MSPSSIVPVLPSRGRKRAVGLLATAAILALGSVLQPIAAHAAEIPDAVTGITVTNDTATTPVKSFEQLTVTADWNVPDNSSPGDTFSLTLPAELEGLTDSFALENDAGEAFGTCVVSASDVVCTLTDLVTTKPLSVGGSLFFSAKFTDQVVEGEVNDLIFTTGTVTETVPVDVAPGVPYDGNAFRKSGIVNDDGTISWKVEFPAGPGGLEQTLTDVVVSDTLSPSLSFVGAEDVVLLRGTSLTVDGTNPAYDEEVDRATYSVAITGQTATVSIPELEAGFFYSIEIQTVPVAGAVPPFTNSAILSANELPDTLTFESTIEYTAGGDAGGIAPPPAAGAGGNVTPVRELANTGAASTLTMGLAGLAAMSVLGGLLLTTRARKLSAR